jgi:TM2 domain-containing membrane protein YozV
MKLKLFISVFAFFIIAFSPAYASFPVQKTLTTSTVTKESQKEIMTSPAIAVSGKSQVTALLLCLFVGIIGIHRFYLGYIWQGIVQVLTLGGLGVWSLIDLIRIITGDLQPKNGSYSKTL